MVFLFFGGVEVSGILSDSYGVLYRVPYCVQFPTPTTTLPSGGSAWESLSFLFGGMFFSLRGGGCLRSEVATLRVAKLVHTLDYL